MSNVYILLETQQLYVGIKMRLNDILYIQYYIL